MLDSHCHLNDDTLFSNYKEIVEESFNAGVHTLLVVGWDVESSKKAVQIANEYTNIYAAVGVHPENIEGLTFDALDTIKELAKNKKVIAIGEIGLDYHWFKDIEVRKKQQEWFVKQIELANELNLPISIHARDASEDTYSILKNNNVARKGVLHCYSGSVEMMEKFCELGFYFGFDGPVTFKNAKTVIECIKFCPSNKILTETDCPYLSPEPFRGKTNQPKNIKYILEKISEIKEIKVDEMEKLILENFNKLFHGEL